MNIPINTFAIGSNKGHLHAAIYKNISANINFYRVYYHFPLCMSAGTVKYKVAPLSPMIPELIVILTFRT